MLCLVCVCQTQINYLLTYLGDYKEFPSFALTTWLIGVLKSLWAPHSECVFARCYGGTSTCENSQELTPGLLELKATGIFTAFVPLTVV